MWLLVVGILCMEDRRRGAKLERSVATASGWNRLQQQVTSDVAGLVDLPGGERCLWMQKMVSELWPYITVAAAEMIQQEIQPLLDAHRPSFLTKLGFSAFDLGPAVPIITSVRVSDVSSPGSPGLSIDLGIMMRTAGSNLAFDVEIENPLEAAGWTWAAELVRTVNPLRKAGRPAGAPSVRFGVQVEDVEFSGVVRLAMRPLMPVLPVAQAVQVSLLDTPKFDFSLRARGVDVLDVSITPTVQAGIDFVHDYVISTILSQLESTMVWPHGIVEPLVYDSRRNAEIMRRATSTSSDTCVGVLKVKVIGVRGLPPLMLQRAAASVVLDARARARAAGVSVGMGVGVGGMGLGVGMGAMYMPAGAGMFPYDLSPAKAAPDGATSKASTAPAVTGQRGMRGAAVADLLTGDATLITDLIGNVGKPGVCPLRPGAMGGATGPSFPSGAWQHWLGAIPAPSPGAAVSSSKPLSKAAIKAANIAPMLPPSPMRTSGSMMGHGAMMGHMSQVQWMQRTLAASDQRLQMSKHLVQLKRMEQLKEKWGEAAAAADLPGDEPRRRRSEPIALSRGQRIDFLSPGVGMGGFAGGVRADANEGRLGGDWIGGPQGAEAGGEGAWGAWGRLERQHSQNSMYSSSPQLQQRQQQRQQQRRGDHRRGRQDRKQREKEERMHQAMDALAAGLDMRFRVGMGQAHAQAAHAYARRAAGQGESAADGISDIAAAPAGRRGGLSDREQTNHLSAAEIQLLPISPSQSHSALDMNFVTGADTDDEMSTQHGQGRHNAGVDKELVEHTATFLVYWPAREQLDLNFVLPTPASLQLPPHQRGAKSRPGPSVAKRKAQEAAQRKASADSAKRRFKMQGLSGDVAAAAAAAQMGTQLGDSVFGHAAGSTTAKQERSTASNSSSGGVSGGGEGDDVGLVAATAIALSSLAKPEYAHQPRVIWQPLTLHASPLTASAAASGAATPVRRPRTRMPASAPAGIARPTAASDLDQALADARDEDDDNVSEHSEQSSGVSSQSSEQSRGVYEMDGNERAQHDDQGPASSAQECMVGLQVTWHPLQCDVENHLASGAGGADTNARAASVAATAAAAAAAVDDAADPEVDITTSPTAASSVGAGLNLRLSAAEPPFGPPLGRISPLPRQLPPLFHSGVVRITL
jgi:hypothetical protein